MPGHLILGPAPDFPGNVDLFQDLFGRGGPVEERQEGRKKKIVGLFPFRLATLIGHRVFRRFFQFRLGEIPFRNPARFAKAWISSPTQQPT